MAAAPGFLLCTWMMFVPAAGDAGTDADGWSQPVNGLQARLVLVEKSHELGVRRLVPYLELRNTRNLNNGMHVNCDSRHLTIELIDGKGEVINDWRRARERSGSVPDLNSIVLPYDSSMKISLECGGWGISRSAAAVISTDSGAWCLRENDRRKVFLRATLTGEKPQSRPFSKSWHGELQTPLIPVDWDSTIQ